MKSKIISIALIILIICASIFGFKKIKEADRRIERCTEKTTAKIIEHTITTNTKPRSSYKQYFHHITVKYKVDGKEYEIKGVYRGEKTTSLDPGTKIDIRYNPKNPQEITPEFTIGYTAPNKLEGYVCISILALFATLAVVGFYKTSKRKEMMKD